MTQKDIKTITEHVDEMKFYTRGLPMAKKMWRDGYNKGVSDLLNYILMLKGGEK